MMFELFVFQVYDDASIQTAMKQILAKTMMSEAFPTLTGEKPPQGSILYSILYSFEILPIH